MKMTKYVSLIAVLMAVVTTAGWLSAAESICPRFAISSVEEPDVFNVAKYSAVKTTDLKIHVVLPDQFKEEHVISLKFFTPAGHLYRQIDVPVTPEIGREGTQTRRLPGYPYPVTVAVPEALSSAPLNTTVSPWRTNHPKWSKWAPSTMYSSLSSGSWPGITPTTLIPGMLRIPSRAIKG